MRIPRKAVTVIRCDFDIAPLRNWEGVRIVPEGTDDKPGYLLYFLPRQVADSPLRTPGGMNTEQRECIIIQQQRFLVII